MTESWDCVICGEPVNLYLRSGWAQKVTGWEEVRRQGGANKIMKREVVPGTVAHVSCLRFGSSDQGAML